MSCCPSERFLRRLSSIDYERATRIPRDGVSIKNAPILLQVLRSSGHVTVNVVITPRGDSRGFGGYCVETQDSHWLSIGAKLAPMRCTETLKTRVSPEMKLQAIAIADREFLSEAAWLRRLVMREIRARNDASDAESDLLPPESIPGPARAAPGKDGAGKPMLVRLTAEDRLLLDARAEARGMRPATYASVLLRSHLRQLTPLPKDELLALKRSVAELGSIGRNINQIARAVSGGGEVPGSLRGEFWAMLKICSALRDNTKALLKANLTSWVAGDARGGR
jgi:hypothetical protein